MPLNRHHVKQSLDFPLEEGSLLVLEPAGQGELDPEVFFTYKEKLSSKGYTLLYIPYIANAMSIDTIRYYVPEYDGNPYIDKIQSRIGATLGLEIQSPLVIKRKLGNLIVIESDKPGATTEALLSSLVEELPQRSAQQFISGLSSVVGAVAEKCDFHCASEKYHEVDNELSEGLSREELLLQFMLTKKTEELRDFGVPEGLIEYLLERKDTKLSRIRINKYGKIILEDYNNQEINMDTKTKTLYFLYLRHPEGIVIKNLPRYYEEAYDLYQSLSNRDDVAAQKSAVRNLLDPYKGDVKSCLSRIKAAFKTKICESIAKNYYVDGPKGEKRNIPLDRNMVTWETIR